MNKFRNDFNKLALVKILGSVKLTVSCLLLLFILVFWGTVAQVDHGLFYAQKRYFYSLFFLAGGFFPFPGAQLVLWVLFFNLLCVSIGRFIFQWRNIGILIIHLGLLTYFVSAFMTFVMCKESQISLYETEGANVSVDYYRWELSVWPGEADESKKNVYAYDIQRPYNNKSYVFDKFGMTIELESYYENAKVEIKDEALSLTRLKNEKEPESNMPAGNFLVKFNDGTEKNIVLSGRMASPITFSDKNVNIELRRKHYVLPFNLTLVRFNKEVHPNTQIASKYESYVEIEHDGLKRSKKIYMNNPLRFKNFTLYQASFAIDQMGRHKSTLAVVQNSAQIMPYVSSLLVFMGLLVHFLGQVLMRMVRKKLNA